MSQRLKSLRSTVEKEPRLIAPQEPELWLLKESNHLRIFPNFVETAGLCSNTCFSGPEWNLKKFKNLELTEGSALAIKKGSRTLGTSGRQAKVGKIVTVFPLILFK